MPYSNFSISAVQLEDVDEQADMLINWEQEYQQLGCGRFSGSLATAQADEFTFIRETTNQALHERIMPPEDIVVVGMCSADTDGHTFNGRPLSQNSLILIDDRRCHDIRTGGYAELMGIAVERDLFLSQLHEQDYAYAQESLDTTVIQLDPRAATMLRQYFSIMSDLLKNPEGELPPGMSPRLLASTMVSNIALALSLSRDGQEAEILPRSRQRRDRIVQNAIDYMRKYAGDEIGILDVCAATHVSRRTLQYCFEECLHISPLQYLKALRLNAARRQLKRLMESQVVHEHENTIASVAALCGFNHASRFASDYKKMFGVLPSQIALSSQGMFNDAGEQYVV